MQLYELGTINRPIIAGVERCPGLTTALPIGRSVEPTPIVDLYACYCKYNSLSNY